MTQNWYSKLTEAEKSIWKMIYYNPTMITNRSQALNMMFCCIGTGIDWQNGKLHDFIDDNYLNSKRTRRNYINEITQKAWENTFNHPLLSNELRREWAEWIRDFCYFDNCLAEYVTANIEKLVTTSVPLDYFYPINGYSNLATVPDDVEDDWLDLAIETCNLVLCCDPKLEDRQIPNRNKNNIKEAKKIKKKLEKLKNKRKET